MTTTRREELINAFKARFGSDLAVDVEANGNPPRYEFLLTSPGFKGMSHLRRQDAVWEVIDGLLTREEALEVTGVLPLG
jgi:stress-induced morphogen